MKQKSNPMFKLYISAKTTTNSSNEKLFSFAIVTELGSEFYAELREKREDRNEWKKFYSQHENELLYGDHSIYMSEKLHFTGEEGCSPCCYNIHMRNISNKVIKVLQKWMNHEIIIACACDYQIPDSIPFYFHGTTEELSIFQYHLPCLNQFHLQLHGYVNDSKNDTLINDLSKSVKNWKEFIPSETREKDTALLSATLLRLITKINKDYIKSPEQKRDNHGKYPDPSKGDRLTPLRDPNPYERIMLLNCGLEPIEDFMVWHYLYDYSDNKVNRNGTPIPKITGILFVRISTKDVYQCAYPETSGRYEMIGNTDEPELYELLRTQYYL